MNQADGMTKWPNTPFEEQDIAQAVDHTAVKVWILFNGRSIMPSDFGICIYSLGYFPFQPVIHSWSINGRSMCYPVFEKVHRKDPLLVIGKSSLCGDGVFLLKKYHNDHMLDVQWWYDDMKINAV